MQERFLKSQYESPKTLKIIQFSSSWISSLCSAGFTLVCEKDENRLIAENVLDHVIRHLQEYCQIILQPSEASW